MLRSSTTLMLGFLLAGPALAQGKADPRAVAECSERHESFTQVERCLPDVHVGYIVLDAIADTYGPVGEQLSARCLELNDNKTDRASVCAGNAIEAAIRLAAKLPEGTSIDDPLFDALKDPVAYAEIQPAYEAAKEVFPEKRVWGGTMYTPLR